MFVTRSALHIAIGVMLYLGDALLLGFLECLGILNAFTQTIRQSTNKVEVTFSPLYLVLTDCLLQTCNILNVTISSTFAFTRFVMSLFDFLTQFTLINLTVLDILSILLCKLQPCIFKSSFIGYGNITTTHSLLRISNSILYIAFFPSMCLLKHMHDVRSFRIKFSLDFNTSCINLAASDGHQTIQTILCIPQLVINHYIHNLLHITLDVVVSYTILNGCKQSYHLLPCQSVQIATIHQHTRKVGNTLDGCLVECTL